MVDEIAIANILRDVELQARCRINRKVVAEYAEVMKREGLEAFPPVDVFQSGDSYWLADGFHRVMAMLELLTADGVTLQKVRCVVHQGSKEDAIWHACGSNRQHGLQRTNEDKKRAVKNALHQHPEKSDTTIAKHVGVSDKTVAKYRREMQAAGEIPKSPLREGTDGRLIDTGNIGNGCRQQVSQETCTTSLSAPAQQGRSDGMSDQTAATKITERQTDQTFEPDIDKADAFCSVGYGGRTPVELIDLLVQANVKTVVDVRLRPDKASMGAFMKAKTADKGIEKLLGDAGINYVSHIQLGNIFLEFDDWREKYREFLNRAGDLVVPDLIDLPLRVCLLCSEKRCSDCHRELIAEYLARHGCDVQHLE